MCVYVSVTAEQRKEVKEGDGGSGGEKEIADGGEIHVDKSCGQ